VSGIFQTLPGLLSLSPNTSTRKFQNGLFIVVEEREGKGACLMTQSLFLPSIMGK